MPHYYLSNDGQTAGPFSINDLLTQGLRPSSLLWHEGLTSWQPATTIPEVAALLAPPIAIPVPPPLPTDLGSSAFPSVSSSPASELFARNRAAWITGALVGVLLLVVGLAKLSANGADDSTGSWFSFSDPKPAPLDRVDSAGIALEQARQELKEAEECAEERAEQQRREARRRWHREHFMEYVQADVLPGYRVVGFGGIADGHVQFLNKSGYRVRDAVIAVQYIKSNGGVYKTEYLTLDEIGAHESRVLEIPESGRGTSLFCFVQSLQAPGLSFHYNADQVDAE